MTKKSEIPHTRRKVPDFGKQEETPEETKNPQFRILRYAAVLSDISVGQLDVFGAFY